MRSDNDPQGADRRGFLRKVTGWFSFALSGVISLPGLAFLVHPLRKDTVDAGSAPMDVPASESQIMPEQPVLVEVRGGLRDAWMRIPDVKLGSCWLVREKRGAPIRALSTVCPHLGCGIDWMVKRKQFLCPCHDTYFDLRGKVITGPSPRGMDELDVKQGEGGRLKVAYRRFRLGTSKKVEV